MKKSILKIVIILICIFGFIIYYSMKTLPKELKKYGLENYFSYKNYNTMIEFNYDKGEDFAIVLDKNKCEQMGRNAYKVSTKDVEEKIFKEIKKLVGR